MDIIPTCLVEWHEPGHEFVSLVSQASQQTHSHHQNRNNNSGGKNTLALHCITFEDFDFYFC